MRLIYLTRAIKQKINLGFLGQLTRYWTPGLQTNAEINYDVRHMSHESYGLEYFVATSILYNKYLDLFYIVQHKEY